MDLANLEEIFGALNEAAARYVVVGGLAVIAHGYVRYTNDVDLVVAFEPANMERAMKALRDLGYRPKIPVDPLEFADPVKRRSWVEQKGMVVFQLVNDRFQREPIDVFVFEPFDIERACANCEWRELGPTLKIPVIDLDQLLAMKRLANRERDRLDVDQLTKLKKFRDEPKS